MILPHGFHPRQQKSSSKDDFPSLISSLPIKILSQGLFFPAHFIPAGKNSLPEMILPRGFHPRRLKPSSNDDSYPLISSLPIKTLFQG